MGRRVFFFISAWPNNELHVVILSYLKMLFLHIHMYFGPCYFYTISFSIFLPIFLFSSNLQKITNYLDIRTWSTEKKLHPLYVSTLQIHIVCSLKPSKWIFYLRNGNRWSPFKNNGERNVNTISIFYGNLNQRHQALKVQRENTTIVKFQGILHPNEGEIFLFYFLLD